MFLKHNTFTLFFLGLILLGCLLPGNDLPGIATQNLDKAIHIFFFFCFSFSAMVGFAKQSQYPKLHYDAIKYVIVIAVALTITTELLQHYVIPRRNFDLYDILADLVGMVLALVFFLFVKGKERCGF